MPAAAAAGGGGVNVPPTYAAAVPAMPMQQPVALDPTNPFAQSVFQQPVGATSSTSGKFWLVNQVKCFLVAKTMECSFFGFCLR